MDQSIKQNSRAEIVTSQAAHFIWALEESTIPREVLAKAQTCILYGFGIRARSSAPNS